MSEAILLEVVETTYVPLDDEGRTLRRRKHPSEPRHAVLAGWVSCDVLPAPPWIPRDAKGYYMTPTALCGQERPFFNRSNDYWSAEHKRLHADMIMWDVVYGERTKPTCKECLAAVDDEHVIITYHLQLRHDYWRCPIPCADCAWDPCAEGAAKLRREAWACPIPCDECVGSVRRDRCAPNRCKPIKTAQEERP